MSKPAERVKRAQARQAEEGWRRLSLRLPPQAVKDLEWHMRRTKLGPTALIKQLLRNRPLC